MKTICFLSLNALQFVPYAYGLLKSFACRDQRIAQGYLWQEPITRIEGVVRTAGKINAPDILCASTYVWNANQQLAVAKTVKQKFPDCKVVFGGPHVPDAGAGFLSSHPYVDVLVHGEGEIPFYQLLLAFLDTPPNLATIPNISFTI